MPKRASSSGCRGRRIFCLKMSSPSRSKDAEEGPKIRFQALPASPSPAAVSSIERSIVAAPPPSKRVREVDLGPGPLEPVPVEPQRRQRRRVDDQRVHRRAVVVEQAGQGQLAGAGAAADRRRRPRSPSPPPRGSPGSPRRPARWGRRRRSPPRSCPALGRERLAVEPGLALDHVGDLHPALLDQAPRRRRRSGSAGAVRWPAGTRASPPAARRARTRSAPGPPRAAGRCGSGRRRSCSRARRRRPARPRGRRRRRRRRRRAGAAR